MAFSIIDSLLANFIYIALHIGNHGSFPPPLKAEEERICLEQLKQGDEKAKNKLIEHNLRLVAHILKKYYSTMSDQDDLLSIGTLGLIKGINSYDIEKGTRLSTYAAKCIENEILMYFRSMKKIANEVSLNEPIDSDNDGESITIIDTIQVDDDIVENLNKKNNLICVRKYVNEIKDSRERQIIKMRYGMDGTTAKTQREVAQELGISRSYVSRIETRVLAMLKKRLEQEKNF